MKKYNKSYIGKGTQVANMDIVKITLKVEELLKVTHEFQGVKYLTFELAKMQSKDDYGRTHTAYVSVLEDDVARVDAEDRAAEKAAAKAAKKAAKAAKKEEPVLETAGSEIPF
jgi:predicted metal-dependent hydrolase